MDTFPFTTEEWETVRRASHAVVNATLWDDDPLRESLYQQLLDVLSELRRRHGSHPVLLETQADFESDTPEQIRLYHAALALATEEGLPTFTIQLSLARVLIVDVGDAHTARRHLLLCKQAVQAHGDGSEREEWTELWALCRAHRD